MSLKVDSWLRHVEWIQPNSGSFYLVFCEVREGLRRAEGHWKSLLLHTSDFSRRPENEQSVYPGWCEHQRTLSLPLSSESVLN